MLSRILGKQLQSRGSEVSDMATITITLTDKDNGKANVSVECDPPLKLDENGTPAQRLASAAIDGIAREAAEGTT
jgi:hypothetical protein